MASFISIYNEIEFKIKQTVERLKEYKAENELLKTENLLLKTKNDELNNDVIELEEKLKLLSITQTFLKKEDKKVTKKKINDLVREIDNCIALLNSEE